MARTPTKRKTTRVGKAAAKVLTKKIVGDEPVFVPGEEISGIQLIKSYNWYTSMYNQKESVDLAVNYFKQIKDRDMIKTLRTLNTDQVPTSFCYNCRIKQIGGMLPESVETNFQKHMETLKQKASGKREERKQTQKLSVYDRVLMSCIPMLNKIDDLVFDCISGDKTITPESFEFKHANGPQMKIIKKHLKVIYDDLASKDPEIVESYSHWKKTDKTRTVKLLATLIEQKTPPVSSAKKPAVRKPKVTRKTKTPKLSVKYKENDAALGIKSLKPEKVIGATHVVYYNTVQKKLGVLKAAGTSKLEFKGASIVNFDPATSFETRCSKPDVVKDMTKAGVRKLNALRKDSRHVKGEISGRLGANTLILKVL